MRTSILFKWLNRKSYSAWAVFHRIWDRYPLTSAQSWCSPYWELQPRVVL